MNLDAWNNLSTRSKLIGVGAILAAIIVFYSIYSLSSHTSYSLLVNQLDATESANITNALSKAGISYQEADAGASIEVPSGKMDQARALLAQNNLLNGGHVGWEIFNKTSLGATDVQQQAEYQQAINGEVARAIQAIDGVQSAIVNIALPKQQLFSNEQSTTTASVILNLGGHTLQESQVQGIAQLVASAVPGLDPKNVSIVDENGTPLNGGSTSSGSSFMQDSAKLTAQQSYEQQKEADLQAMLDRVVGPNKATVQVAADLNWDQTHLQSETWGKTGVPSSKTTDNETYNGNGSVPAGAAGTSSNLPTYAQGGASNGKSNYKHVQTQTNYAISKTITDTNVAPGEVKRQTVSVLVDTSIPAAQLPAIKSAISAAIGYDPNRQDIVNVARVPFATTAGVPVAATGGISKLMPMIKIGGSALAAVLLLLFLIFNFRRREKLMATVSMGQLPPSASVEITGGVPAPTPELLDPREQALAAEARAREDLQSQAEDAARTHPKESATMISNWLND